MEWKFWGIFGKIFLIAIKLISVLHEVIRRYIAHEELWGKSYSSRQNGYVHTFFEFIVHN
jgi:hypothetical protein